MHHDPRETIDRVVADRGLSLLSWQAGLSDFAGDTRQFGYQARVRDAGGTESTLHLVVAETPAVPAAPGTIATADGPTVRTWVYPEDPALPALPAAVTPSSVGTMLARLGYDSRVSGLTMLSYRAGRRAVLRVETGGGRAYLKVVPPARAEDLRRRHEDFLAAGLPVPPVLAFSPEGLLLLAELPGVVASERLAELAGDPRFLENLDRLRDSFDAVRTTAVSRPGPAERWDWYAARLGENLPAEAGRIAALREVLAAASHGAVHRQGIRHGDLHLEQLMVDPSQPGTILGLLDIDTAGHGDPLGDSSGFLAELVRRAESARHEGDERTAGMAESLAAAALARWRPVRAADAAPWHAACAAQLLAHALSPSGTPASTPLALRLLLRAEYAAAEVKNSLMPASSSP